MNRASGVALLARDIAEVENPGKARPTDLSKRASGLTRRQ
jgi:hypothetical protein